MRTRVLRWGLGWLRVAPLQQLARFVGGAGFLGLSFVHSGLGNESNKGGNDTLKKKKKRKRKRKRTRNIHLRTYL